MSRSASQGLWVAYPGQPTKSVSAALFACDSNSNVLSVGSRRMSRPALPPLCPPSRDGGAGVPFGKAEERVSEVQQQPLAGWTGTLHELLNARHDRGGNGAGHWGSLLHHHLERHTESFGQGIQRDDRGGRVPALYLGQELVGDAGIFGKPGLGQLRCSAQFPYPFPDLGKQFVTLQVGPRPGCLDRSGPVPLCP